MAAPRFPPGPPRRPRRMVDQDPYDMPNNARGMMTQPSADIHNPPRYQNPDGSISTVYSFGVNFDGREYLLPRISADGRLMSQQEAEEEFRRTGRHLGVFDSPQASDDYAERLHRYHDRRFTR